jgi:hypothetical protein
VEGLGGAHRVLAGETVRHQKRLGRVADAHDLGRLGHHRLVQRRAARRVEDENVVATEPGGGERAAGDVGGALAGHDRQRLDLGPHAELRQLLHGRRTARVQRGHERLLALDGPEAQAELGRQSRLARALQAGDQDHHRWGRGEIERDRLVAAERLDEAVVDDLDDLVGRPDRADHRFAAGLLARPGDEIARHRQRDIGLEQGQAHLAQRLFDVLLRQQAATAQPVEDPRQPLA